MVNQLDRLRDVLLVQCQPAEAEQALQLARRRGAGVVVTNPIDPTDRAEAVTPRVR